MNCGHTSRGTAEFCPACAVTAAFHAPVRRFGRYEVLENLGGGGMGEVYLAYDNASGRLVALKTPSSDGSDETIQRFRSEAEAVAGLEHPGIIPIYEVGEAQGLPFFTMKFAEGGSLAGRIDEYREPRRAAELVAGVAEAVHYAHARGILHRDLKPQNILLDEAGHAFVSDFGISRWLDRDGDLTRTGSLLGSPNYIAPEQLVASPRNLTVGADVFSLGAILYHLLSGEPPFRADSLASTLHRLGSGDLRPLPVGTPRDLAAICRHALEPEPSARYESARDLAADLRAWLGDRPLLVRRSAAAERLWRWARRNPLPAMLVALVILSLAAGGGFSTFSHQRALAAETARADAAETLARDRLRASLLAEARTLRLSGLPGQRTGALAKLHEAWALEPSVDIRNEAVAALVLPDLSQPAESGPPPFRERAQSFTAEVGDSEKILTIKGREGESLANLSFTHRITSLAWTPGQEMLILGTANKHVWIWNRATKELIRHITGRADVSAQLAVSHRGNFVADITYEGALRIWQTESGEDLITASFGVDTETPPQWAADDSAIYFKRRGSAKWYRTEVILPRVSSYFRPPKPEETFEDARTIDLNQSGRYAATSTENRVRIWDLETGTVSGEWLKYQEEWAPARFLPKKDVLLVGGWSSDVLEIPISAPYHARKLQRLPGAFLVDLARDGSLAGFVDNTDQDFKILAAPFDQPPIRIPQQKPFEIAIEPGTRWMALSSFGEAKVRIVGWPGLEPLATLDAEGVASRLAVAPGGDRLYLATDSGGSEWRTDDWTKVRTIRLDEAQQSARYLDSGIILIQTRRSIRLHDTATGRELVRLPTQESSRQRSSVSFTTSHDGQLLAVQTTEGGIQLWYLPALREELAEFGMDW